MNLRKGSLLSKIIESPSFPVLLWLTSSFIFAGRFLFYGSHFGDTGKLFSLFRDIMHSLNAFGEPAWWLPNYQTGTPGYFFAILNAASFSTPCAALTGFVLWALGVLGIHLQKFQPAYVLYYGFLIPGIFLIASRLLIWRLFANRFVRTYALVLAAFSPGVAFNNTDLGALEPGCYGIIFVVTLLDWIHASSRSNYLKLLLATALLSVSVNVGFIYFNLFGIPLFLLLWYFFFGKKAVKTALSHLKPQGTALLLLVALSCFLPNLITVTHGSEIVRSSLGETLKYPYEKLLAGSPLEFLTASLPGFGFDWHELRMLLLPISKEHHVAYYYMGLLALPFFVFGLVHGHRRSATFIFLFVAFFSLLVCFSAYSPFFGALMLFPTPIKGCNHFSDQTYHAGVFLAVLLAAAFGFKTYLEKPILRSRFIYFFLGSGAFTIGTFFIFHGSRAWEQREFTYFCATLFFIAVLLHWLQTSQRAGATRNIVKGLLVLTLLDVGTFSFLWVRSFWMKDADHPSELGRSILVAEIPAANGIGLKNSPWFYHQPNLVLMLRPFFRMRINGYDSTHLPRFRFFTSLRAQGDLRSELDNYALNGFASDLILPVSREDLKEPTYQTFLTTPALNIPNRIEVVRETYNSVELRLNPPTAGVLFFGDAYSPFWNATVNGSTVRIIKAFFNYKAISLNAGENIIRFNFNPFPLPYALALAYGIIGALSFALLWVTCFTHRTRQITSSEIPMPTPAPHTWSIGRVIFSSRRHPGIRSFCFWIRTFLCSFTKYLMVSKTARSKAPG